MMMMGRTEGKRIVFFCLASAVCGAAAAAAAAVQTTTIKQRTNLVWFKKKV